MVLAALFAVGNGVAFGQPASAQLNSIDLEKLHAQLPDIDTRTDTLLPSATQLQQVQALGAVATWNKFGTPKSLIKYDGDLATGLKGDAASATRAWLRANAALFKLTSTSVDALELVSDSVIPETTAHVVLYRQKFGGLTAAQDGMITIAFVDGAIPYVSSSSAGDAQLVGKVALTPIKAWLAAAASIGRNVDAAKVTSTVASTGWNVLKVPGFAQDQQVRLRALPMPGRAARPVFETNVVNSNGSDVLAYTMMVDAVNGNILVRQSRMDDFGEGSSAFSISAQASTPPLPETFSGSFTPPSTCGPKHGPYAVASGIGSLTVVATAFLPSNDIVLTLSRGATVVASSDTATSPEGIVYSPAGGVPTGNYYVQVCPYGTPTVPFIAPYNYTGTFFQSAASTSVLPAYAKWQYFQSNPALNYASTDNRTVGCWRVMNPSVRPGDCQRLVNSYASRVPWDLEVRSGSSSHTTIGNNALTARAWGSPLTPAEQYRPLSLTREYKFPWTNQWNTSKCNPTSFASPAMIDSDAAVTNLFVLHNRMHDWSYLLGFNELNWNAQQYNFGLNDLGANDAEIGNTQAGAADGGYPSFLGRDNANQIALQDGVPGITNMYLWQPIAGGFYAACSDGDYDMSVVGHEYTHLISNRMVGGPDSSLTGHQAGSMGESWSDLDALELLQAYNFQSISTAAGYTVGAYVTGNQTTGIRNYNNSTAAGNPLNYSDVGYDVGGPEVHSDAEIWDAVNHDIRRALIAKYRANYPETDTVQQLQCAQGGEPAYHCPGNRRWIKMMFTAFLLMPADVDMLGARDAYLGAERALHLGYGNHTTCGGWCWPSNQTEVWNAFAGRGMGEKAVSTSSDDTDPTPNFESPLVTNEAQITFNVIAPDESNAAVKAKIYVGDYEARSVAIADTDSATPLLNKASFVPGTYRFVIQAPGYGLYRYTATLKASQVATLNIAMPTNWASATKGATVSNGGGTGTDTTLAALIDDTENTAWLRDGATPNVDGAAAIVKLGAAKTIKRVQVSGLQSPGGGRFKAPRQFEVWTCRASVANANCALANSFTKIYTSPADAFPGTAPRPLQPQLNMRSFTVPATTATHVMLKVVHNQCTGTPAFAGEQDNDPLNATDCQSGSTADETLSVAEFEVFTR